MIIRWILAITLWATATAVMAGNTAAVNTKGLLNSAAIKGYDPVTYWNNNKPQKGDKQWSFEWRGANWLFSSAENKTLFIQNPQKYAPQYGGYCAWAMADGKGRTVAIDPNAWVIYNNKLYLNYNLKVKEEWLKTKDQDITVADKNYPTITNVSQYQ